MHIPDGYLSPQTYIPLYALTVPFLAVAARKVRETLRSRHVPLLALGAAFSFVIMMFNFPVPGGTTGHAVGSVVVAIVLGPWAACVAVSTALIVQALLFGDGGITVLGANCFTMAIVMPFVGYYSYRLIAGNSPLVSRRQAIATAMAGYLALNAAALYTAILFGIQPLIATGADGRPLYAPYPLSVAVPAMALEHLLLFGLIEGAVTALVVTYIQRTNIALTGMHRTAGVELVGIAGRLRMWLGILVLLSPLGVIIPKVFNAGSAWGEWDVREVARMVGFVPEGMKKTAFLWDAPIPDYGIEGAETLGMQGLIYSASALFGVAIIAVSLRIWSRFLVMKGGK